MPQATNPTDYTTLQTTGATIAAQWPSLARIIQDQLVWADAIKTVGTFPDERLNVIGVGNGAGNHIQAAMRGSNSNTGSLSINTNTDAAPNWTNAATWTTAGLQFDLPPRYFETAAGLAASQATVNWETSTFQTLTLNQNVTSFDWTPPPGSGLGNANVLFLLVKQSGGATFVVSGWPASVAWPGGTAPTITTGAGASDLIVFVDIGGAQYGFFFQNFS